MENKDKSQLEVTTRLSSAQILSLQSAWDLFKPGFIDHAANIFAKFYEQNPEYLKFFNDLDNEALHQHTDQFLESIGDLIETGLKGTEKFMSSLEDIVENHPEINQTYVKSLNQLIREEILHQVQKHKTKTLEDALDLFFTHIEINIKILEGMKRNEEAQQ